MLEDGKRIDWPNVAPSVLVTKSGVRVGIIGVTTMSTPSTTISANVVGLSMVPIVDAITAEAKALRDQGAKVIVVAAHAGGHCEKLDVPTDLASCDKSAEIFDVARKLPAGVVQAIVAGHTHQNVAHEVAGIPIIESSANGTAFGRVDIVVEAATGKVVRTKIHPPQKVTAGGDFEGAKTEPSPDVEATVAQAIERGKELRARSLKATVEGTFQAKYQDECALGNLVTSLMLDLDPKMDIAFSNGGGLRADLAPGLLTYGAFYDVLPFDNRIARLTMTGKKLKDTLRRNLHGKGGILSIAGARVEERCVGGKAVVEIVLTGKGKPERKVGDGDRVRVITNEFLATKGDDFGPADQVEIDEEGPPFRDPMAALLEKRGGVLRPDDWLLPGKPRIVRDLPKSGDCAPMP
jgi:5'-nucleotidase